MSNQKEVAGKKGLGFATKSKKKKKNKTKQSPPLKDIFVKEGESTHKKIKNKEGVTMPRRAKLLEICPRGKNKIVIIIFHVSR